MKTRAYINGEYRTIEVEDYQPTAEELIQQKKDEIEEIVNELSKYDYIGTKISTGCATIEQYSEQIAYCEGLREKIRQLEREVNNG